MSQRSRRRRRAHTEPAIPPPQWDDASCLEPVRELNERFLELLAEAARLDGERCSLDIVRLHLDLWLGLPDAIRIRAAQFPFLLANVHFERDEWWQQNTDGHSGKSTSPPNVLPRKLAIELMHDALLLAWHIARSNPTANVLLAMSPGVAATVANLRLRDIRRLAENQHRHLRPRWEQLPLFWRHLLHAAGSDDGDAIHNLRVHGVQLLDADSLSLAPHSSPARPLPAE
jgi:hypothetical protein